MPMTPMLIEQAEAADAEAITAVLEDAARWLAETGQSLWPKADFSLDRTRGDVLDGRFFVARGHGEVVGVMRYELEDRIFWPEVGSETSAFVHKLAIHRSCAGQGVSTALLTYALHRTKELGRSFLRLDCRADRPRLRSTYERFGFVLHSIVPIGEWLSARYEIAVAVV
jgi:GNAT superfamily N-acetyltransferase